MKTLDFTQIPQVKVTYSRSAKITDRPQIIRSSDAYQVLKHFWDPNTIDYVEEVKLLLLNRSNRVIGIANLSSGGITGTIVDVRVIFQHALLCSATGIILAHNHPSGNLEASQHDLDITNKINECGKLMNINLLDHIIMSSEGYLSLRDTDMV